MRRVEAFNAVAEKQSARGKCLLRIILCSHLGLREHLPHLTSSLTLLMHVWPQITFNNDHAALSSLPPAPTAPREKAE